MGGTAQERNIPARKLVESSSSTTAPATIPERDEGGMGKEAAVAAEVADTAAAVEEAPMVTEAAVAAEVADTAAAIPGDGDGGPAPMTTRAPEFGTLNFAGGPSSTIGNDGGGRENIAPTE